MRKPETKIHLFGEREARIFGGGDGGGGNKQMYTNVNGNGKCK